MAATRRPELTEEKMARFKEAFRLVDSDGDGRITGKEVGSAMGVLGLDVTELEVQEMLSKGDLDGDGRLNFAEFLIILGWQLGPGELPNFTAQQLAPYKDAFTLYDKDGDGRITTQELEHAMKLLGHEMSQLEVQALIDAGDLDGNGSLDFAEFLILVDRLRLRQSHTGSGLSQQQMEEMEERYKEAFSVLDRNGDGRITALELGAAMQSMGYSPSEGEVREMLQAADADGDGTIDLAEFCTFVARLELEADAEADGDAETEPDVEAKPDAETERE